MTHSNFIIRGFWVLFPQKFGVSSAFIEIFDATQLPGNSGNCTTMISILSLLVSLSHFAGSYPQTSNRIHVSTPASRGARIAALPPAPLLLSWQKKCRVESWVSLAPGLYWCLLSRQLHARGMLLVYLAVHSDDKLVFSPSPHLPAKKQQPTPTQ